MATDFTGNVVSAGGAVFQLDADGKYRAANVTSPGVVRRVFTNADTGTSFTPSPGMIFAEVICVGPGGGGGGLAQSSTHTLGSGAGGAGAWVRSLLTAADIGASQTMTIPAGGAGGAAGANDGAAASDTSFGSLVVADGGSGGQHADSADGGLGGIGGLVANCTGDEKYPGEYGQGGFWENGTGMYWTYGEPKGGSSPWGAYVSTRSAGGGGAGASATDSEGYGTGGSGTYSQGGTGNLAGGDGADGLIIVTEYIRQSVLSPIVYNSAGNKHLDLSVDGRMTLYDETATPQLKLFRNETSTGAHISGQLLFQSQNDAGEQTTYVQIRGQQSDDTDGSEDGYFWIGSMSAGSMTEVLRMSATDGGISFNGGTTYFDGTSGWVKIAESDIVSNVTSLTYTGLGGYSHILIVGHLISNTDNNTVDVEVSTDNGSSWLTSGYICYGHGTGSQSTTEWVAYNGTGWDTNEGFCLNCWMHNFSGNHGDETLFNVFTNTDNNGERAAAAHNAARVLFGGNVDGGIVHVYGIVDPT